MINWEGFGKSDWERFCKSWLQHMQHFNFTNFKGGRTRDSLREGGLKRGNCHFHVFRRDTLCVVRLFMFEHKSVKNDPKKGQSR